MSRVKIVSATFLVVASMLGTGILTTTGIILTHVKAPEAVIAVWVVGGILAWFGAYCYGEIARMLPENGGEATILRSLFSPTLGEIAGWTSFVVAFAASNAASSLALSAYLGQAFPGLAVRPELVASLALILVTSLHSVMGPSGLKIQTLLAIVKFSMLAGLALYAIFLNDPTSFVVHPLQSREVAGFGSHWGVALMLVMFAYSGWNAAIYIAGEAHDPHHTVRNAMIIGTTITLILYVSVNVALLKILPLSEIEGVIPVISVLVKHLFGADASAVFSGLVAFALLSSLGASAFLGPRVLATMLGWLGRNSGVATVSPKLIWMQAILSIVMVMTGTFEQILTIMGFLLGVFPIICVLGLYRRVCDIHHRPPMLARLVFAPLFIGALSLILVLGAMQQPKEVAVALALIASFFVLRLSVRRFF